MYIWVAIFVLVSLNYLVGAINETSSSGDIWHHDSGATRIGNGPTRQSEKKTLSPQTDDRPKKDSPDFSSEEDCNFGGLPVRVAVILQPPLVDCAQDLYGEWICNGSNIEVINVLERRLNFQAQWIVLAGSHAEQVTSLAASSSSSPSSASAFHPPSKSAYKNHHSSGSNESGIVGLVASGRALMSANGVIKTEDRSLLGNLILSEPFDSFKLHLLLSKSVRDHDHIFVKPFSSQAWLAILTAALVMVPIFYLINSSSSHYYLKDDKILSRLSLLTCTRYFISQARWNSRVDRSGSKLSDSCSLFEQEVDRMISSGGLIDFLEPKVVDQKDEIKQQRRFQKRQWIQERRRIRRLGRSARKTGFSKVAYVAWYVVGSLANQGGETEDLPDANSTRILIAFWWLYLIVICSIHSGILTAILTFPKQNDFIQTLDDFLALHPSEQMKLTVDKRSEMAHFLSDPKNLHKSPLQALFKDVGYFGSSRTMNSIIEVDFVRHRQRVLDEVQSGHSAHLEEKSAIDMIITQEYLDSLPPKCQFKASRFPVDVIPMSLALSSRLSPVCVSKINRILRSIMRTGLAQKWRRKYEGPGNDCLYTVNIIAGDVAKIQLRHVVLAFWLLGVGLTIGAMFLIIEIVWLLTADSDEDDASESSLADSSSLNSLAGVSSSSSSDSGTDIRFGHHLGNPRATSKSRVLNTERMLRKTLDMRHLKAKRSAKTAPALPSISASVELDNILDKNAPDGREINKQTLNRKQRTAMRAAGRRQRRLRRTLDLVKRLHEGKIYSDLFVKVSGTVQVQARRASHALIGRIPAFSQTANQQNKVAGESQLQQQHQKTVQSSQFHIRRRRAVRVAAIDDV